ncbi:PaaI family thioesterase [Nocardia sp. alder85J]|uniref:PaaI family thioesterase n=1 Tax=Nocardia sp. alder85J TaxID=2862949 RepID=UPI001CD6C08F|nr:PaaI family thioesterase [Nocardia sp. alder85J]MCX4095711.1 PaaI family thioesterase [Nocardia sp. alder85J]
MNENSQYQHTDPGVGLDPSSPFSAPESADGMRLCYGCRRLQRCRLGIESERLDDKGVVISHVVCESANEGGPEVAHGGWTAGVMDELVGHTLLLNEEFGVTGTLTVKFVRPVPIGWPLIGRAWFTGRENRKVFVRATLVLASSGAVLAEADAIMIKRPDTHFEQHYQWLEGQRGAG